MVLASTVSCSLKDTTTKVTVYSMFKLYKFKKLSDLSRKADYTFIPQNQVFRCCKNAEKVLTSFCCFLQILDFPGNPLVQLQNNVFSQNNLLNLQEVLMSRCRISLVKYCSL